MPGIALIIFIFLYEGVASILANLDGNPQD